MTNFNFISGGAIHSIMAAIHRDSSREPWCNLHVSCRQIQKEPNELLHNAFSTCR